MTTTTDDTIALAYSAALALARILLTLGNGLTLADPPAGQIRSDADLITTVLAPAMETAADAAAIAQLVATDAGLIGQAATASDAVAPFYTAATSCSTALPMIVSPARGRAAMLARGMCAGCEAACLGQAFLAEAQSQFADRQAALDARQRIACAMDGATDRIAAAIGASVYGILDQAARQATAYIVATAASLQPVVRVTALRSFPSTALAWALYGDPTQASALVARNRCGTPLFMPATFEALAPDPELMAAALFEYVTMIVDGYELAGFEEITVRRSYQDAAVAFNLKATWPSYSAPAMRLRNGDQIEIRTQALAQGQAPVPGSGDLLCMGAVDDYEADIGEGASKTVVLHGRSNARDVVDCPPVMHPTLQSTNKTLLGAAQDLGAEFAVTWSTDQDLDTIDKVQARPGEALYATIEREARMQGLMLAGQPDGSISITRAGAKRHQGALIEGQPGVSRWSVKISPAAQRSMVVTRGQRAGGYGAANLRQQDVYPVPGSGSRHRPHMVILEGDRPGNALRTRGKWQHLRSFGFGMVVSPRVSRWRDEGGTLWTPGWLMAVQVRSENIDADLLVSEASFTQRIGKDAGTRAEIVFTDPRNHGGGTPMGTEDSAFDPDDSIG